MFCINHVLVVGLGRSGIAAAKLLAEQGIHVTVYDQKSINELDSAKQMLQSYTIRWAIGEDETDVLLGQEAMVISPGVPIDSALVLKAKMKGMYVLGEIELAYQLLRCPLLAITGTNGKTTTTSLVGEIYKRAGLDICVAGNIGFPLVDYTGTASPKDMAVVEISSFQLESIHQFKPHIALILNITPDHLNRHHTMENYIDTKCRIFENMGEEDTLILNAECPIAGSLGKRAKAKVVYFSRHISLPLGVCIEGEAIISREEGITYSLCNTDELKLIGAHNVENALAAVAAARAGGISCEVIAQGLKNFSGVEHRLKKVDEIQGISFIDDSKGTNPDASIKAVEAMRAPTVLIAGGYDKGVGFEDFVKSWHHHIQGVILIGHTADIIEGTAKAQGFKTVERALTLEEAVRKAFKMVPKGGNVLLSPACASFDMFTDYEERGRVFQQAVKRIKEENR